MDYEIVFKSEFSREEIGFLDGGITEHMTGIFGEVHRGALAFFALDEETKIGGVVGYWSDLGWLYVDALWVDPSRRLSGLGARLMHSIETKAVECGCRGSYLNTMTFQAPGFYEKLGYSEFARLESFSTLPNARLFLKKDLVPDQLQ